MDGAALKAVGMVQMREMLPEPLQATAGDRRGASRPVLFFRALG